MDNSETDSKNSKSKRTEKVQFFGKYTPHLEPSSIGERVKTRIGRNHFLSFKFGQTQTFLEKKKEMKKFTPILVSTKEKKLNTPVIIKTKEPNSPIQISLILK